MPSISRATPRAVRRCWATRATTRIGSLRAMHSIFLRFHNLLADRLRERHPNWTGDAVFAEAQRQVRLHYQWAVLTDFLPTIVGQDSVNAVLPSHECAPDTAPPALLSPACTTGMPVEFSVAAYRFGHSMVRPIYRINTTVADRLPVFDGPSIPPKAWSASSRRRPNFGIDWSFFFLMDAADGVVGKPQSSYKLDNSLVFPLSLLPLPETGPGRPHSPSATCSGASSSGCRRARRSRRRWASRRSETTRSWSARRPATRRRRGDHRRVGRLRRQDAVVDLHPGRGDGQRLQRPRRPDRRRAAGADATGPVGGRIVAETFVGLMAADSSSVLFDTSFRPEPHSRNNQFGFRELIRAVITIPDSPPPPAVTATPTPTATPIPGQRLQPASADQADHYPARERPPAGDGHQHHQPGPDHQRRPVDPVRP